LKREDFVGKYVSVNNSIGNWIVKILSTTNSDTDTRWCFKAYVYKSDYVEEINVIHNFWIMIGKKDWKFISKDEMIMELL